MITDRDRQPAASLYDSIYSTLFLQNLCEKTQLKSQQSSAKSHLCLCSASMADSSSNNIKILGSWASPFVLRTRIALNLKSVDYEFVQENLSVKSELLLKSNPVHKKVPVLLHGHKAVCESLIIVQYIDEAWSSGPAILPTDPYARSVARFWAAYLDDKLYLLMKEIVKAKNEDETKLAVEQVTDVLILLEGVFKQSSNGNAFFGGDHIGYLDIVLGCFLGWVKATESMKGVKIFDEVKTPCLAKWSNDFLDDEAVKNVMPETAKLIEYAKVVFARIRAEAVGN